MKTIKVTNSKTFPFNSDYSGSSNAARGIGETIADAMKNVDFGLGVASSIEEPCSENGYNCRVLYTLSDNLLFCIIFMIGSNLTTTIDSTTKGIYYGLYRPDSTYANYLVRYVTSNSAYTIGNKRTGDFLYCDVSFNIDYMVNNSTLNALYGIDSASSNKSENQLLLDTIENIDGTTTPIVGIVCNSGNSLTVYNRDTAAIVGKVYYDTNWNLQYDGKVLFQKAIVCDTSYNVLGFLRSYYTIYGNVVSSLTSSKLLIDIDGTKYRQVTGNIWTTDTDN